MIKKIIANLILIFIVLAAAEFVSFNKTLKENEQFKTQAAKLKENNVDNYKTQYHILNDFNTTIFRKSFINEKSNKKPLIWFGCSFAEGAGLEDLHTPCYKISNLTGRSCINKAKGATGTQFVYWQLLNDKSLDTDADFVIYTFIWNHLNRLYNYQINPLIYMFNLRYKYDPKHGLKEIKPFFKPLYSSFFIKRILNNKTNKYIHQEEKNFYLFNATMQEISKLVHFKYPNAKFIMIEFPDLTGKELPEDEIKILNGYGIEIFKAKDYFGDINVYDSKHWLPDKIHPKEELWDIILPKLTEKYNMAE